MGRAPCCEKIGLKKGRWTAEEDHILIKFIKDNGEGSWRSLPKKAGLLRCGKSCRLRWINYLRDDLKRGNISEEEEVTIVQLRATLGNRWSIIAGHLPGRTDNEIKNYWNSHLSKKIQDSQKNKDESNTCDNIPRKRKGGRPRKSMKKKNSGETNSTSIKENDENVKENSSKNVESMIINLQPDQPSQTELPKDETLKENSSENDESMIIDLQPDQPNQTELPKDEALKEISGENDENMIIDFQPVLANQTERSKDEVLCNSSDEKGMDVFDEGITSLEEIEKLVDWDLEEIASKLWEREGVDEIRPLILGGESDIFGGIYENREFGSFKDTFLDNWQINYSSVEIWP